MRCCTIGRIAVAACLLGSVAQSQEPSPRRVVAQRLEGLAPDDAEGRLAVARFALEHKLRGRAAELLIEVCGLDSPDARSAAVELLSKTLDYHVDDEGTWQPPEVYYPEKGFVLSKAGWKQPRDLELSELQTLWAKDVLKRVNAFRKENGVRPLRRDSKAERAAVGHASDMAERSYFNHATPEGVTLGERCKAARVKHYGVGENIARGQPTPAAVMTSWIQSPGHRANLLKEKWTKLGVGLAWGTNRRDEPELVWVQVFVNSKKPKRR